MQALGNALNSALRALEANQLGLAVASNNISNAQTPGYTRQRAILRSVEGGTSGALNIGAGVEVSGTEALRDRLIELRQRQEVSSHAQDQMKHQGLSDLEILFNESDGAGMLPLITDFFNSFHALSTDPTSPNRRQEVLTNAAMLTDFLNSRASSLVDIRTRIDRSLNEDVAQANTLIDQIATLTERIVEQEASQPAHELRDQRSVLVQKLSEIVDIHELESHGNYQLTIGSNRPLVYNTASEHLTTFTNSSGLTAIRLGVDDITSEINGGRVGARLDLRDQNIPQYLGSLDQLAFDLVQNVNSVHSAGYDLNGNTGISFFTALTGVAGAAQAITVDAALVANPQRLAASDVANGTGNGTAIALGNMQNASVFSGGSIIEQYRGFIYTLGSDTANAELGMRQHQALLTQLENRRQQVSGVSIDEETIKILQFQRSFEASARVVKAVDELLQLTLTLGS
jgi:flagellar hook-associated protein 1 FlgK